jgi:hypothetical protein
VRARCRVHLLERRGCDVGPQQLAGPFRTSWFPQTPSGYMAGNYVSVSFVDGNAIQSSPSPPRVNVCSVTSPRATCGRRRRRSLSGKRNLSPTPRLFTGRDPRSFGEGRRHATGAWTVVVVTMLSVITASLATASPRSSSATQILHLSSRARGINDFVDTGPSEAGPGDPYMFSERVLLASMSDHRNRPTSSGKERMNRRRV